MNLTNDIVGFEVNTGLVLVAVKLKYFKLLMIELKIELTFDIAL